MKTKIITNYGDYIQEIRNQKNAKIATFNISDDPRLVKDLKLACPQKLLIGISDRECSVGCNDCISRNMERYERIKLVKQRIESNGVTEVKIAANSSLKLTVNAKTAFVGGMNLTESEWVNAMIKVSGDRRLLNKYNKLFDTAWEEAVPYEYTKRPNKYVMGFGKYKGLPWGMVEKFDRGYAFWCRNNVDFIKEAGLEPILAEGED
jgi:hypothetical protein